MKRSALLIVFLVVMIPALAQNGVISRKSNILNFQSGSAGQTISGLSNPLKFGQAASHLSAVSNHLAFGMGRSPIHETVVSTQPEPVAVTTQQSAAVVEKPAERSPVVESKESTSAGSGSPVPAAVIAAPAVAIPVVTAAAEPKKVVGAELGEEYATALPRYHALIIGVSNYKYAGSGFESLENPARDAKQLATVLTEKYSFEKSDVTYLEDPSRHQIIDELELLSTRVGPKDNLLVFYAGHGYYDKQRELGYWLPSDARINSKSEWIANSTVKDYLSTIRSKHTLLITDACFGGSIFKTRSVDSYAMMKVYDLYKDPSRKAITSGNLTEVPDKSLFLEQLLKKLSDNPDDFLPAQKLFTRIYEPVTNNSSAIPKFGVIQGAGDEGGDFVFIRKPN